MKITESDNEACHFNPVDWLTVLVDWQLKE